MPIWSPEPYRVGDAKLRSCFVVRTCKTRVAPSQNNAETSSRTPNVGRLQPVRDERKCLVDFAGQSHIAVAGILLVAGAANVGSEFVERRAAATRLITDDLVGSCLAPDGVFTEAARERIVA